MLHFAVITGLNCVKIDVNLQIIYGLCYRLSRTSVTKKKFKNLQQQQVDAVGSESEDKRVVAVVVKSTYIKGG